jgi:hypothetical protein
MLELKRIYWTRQSLRMAMVALTMWIFAAAFFAVRSNILKPAVSPRATSVTGVFSQMFDGVLAAVALPGVLVVVLIVTVRVIQSRDVRRRDPVRRFTRQQRREGMARAGGQCEMEVGFSRRCARPAEHGDHFYPWPKGGSTSLQNFVAAQQVQPGKRGAGPVARTSGKDGTTPAGLRFSRKSGRCGGTATALLAPLTLSGSRHKYLDKS